MGGGSKMGPKANLRAIEIVDLSRFGAGDFETSEESAVAYHVLLSARSRRGIGLACEWTPLGIRQLAIAVEDSACVFLTPPSAILPVTARDLLTQMQLPKIYAGDLANLKEKVQKSFSLHICGVIDIRTQDSSLEKKAVVKELEQISSMTSSMASADVVAKRAFLSLLALQDPKPQPKAAQAPKVSSELKTKAEWREQGILLSSDGFYCWVCNAGPSGEANMQQHVDSAQHKRRLVLAGIKQDSTILPPVPKEYEDRGISISPTKDGTLQYTCKLCKAGPFPTLESVKSHLGGSKHSLKEGREPELSLSTELAKEGFVLVEGQPGQLHCERCSAGPFDRQGLRQHRLSLQHREAEVNSEMDEQLRQLPGYCRLIGSAFCCYMCDVSSTTLDGMLQHISGKSHRKACVAFDEPEPVILCKELVAGEAWRSYPLHGRLRNAATLEPIWRENVELWSDGPGVRKPSKAPGPVGPTLPRQMVAKEDVEVCDEGFLGAKIGDKVTVLEENTGDEKVWAEKDGKEGWILKTQLVKKLPPWQLQKVKKEPAAPKAKVAAAPVVMRHMITTRNVQHPSPHTLAVSEGQKVELLAFLQSGWACVRDDQGHCGLLPCSALAEAPGPLAADLALSVESNWSKVEEVPQTEVGKDLNWMRATFGGNLRLSG